MIGLSTRVYLDAAAAHPVTEKAKRAFLKALHIYGNPSAAHEEGRAAKAILEEARTRIARQVGAKPEALIFTANATEANAIAVRGAVKAKQQSGVALTDIHLLYLSAAHASVAKTMEALKSEGARVDQIPLQNGEVDLQALAALIGPETLLISIEAVSSETGARVDGRALKRILPSNVILHVDASQAPLVEPIDRTRFGADLMTLDASKIGGVRGIGVLVTHARVALVSVLEGGGQERSLRSGTESPALALAFATALEEAAASRETFVTRSQKLRSALIARIRKEIPDALLNEGADNAPHIVNLSFLGRDTDYLVAILSKKGFAVSTRSSCETDSEEGSRAVLSQTGDVVRATSTLRISWSSSITEGELERFSRALVEGVRFLDRE